VTKSKRIWLLVGILIIAAFLRFYHFTTTPPGLYPDEAIDGNNAAEAATTGHYQVFYTEDNGREGLYVNLIAILLQYFHAPHEPWVVRLPAAIAGVLTVLGLYLLVAELFGDGPGLLAAFLLATCFWHINFSRIGFRAILAPLLLTWALYLLIKAFRAARGRTAIWYAIFAGIVYALGFYTYIAYRITPLLFLLFIPFFKKHPGFWKRAVIFIIAAFIVAAPIGWYFLKHPADFFGRTSEISVTNSSSPLKDFAVNTVKTLLMFNIRGDGNWRHNISGAPELFWPVGLLFVLGIILGIYALWRYWRRRAPPGGTASPSETALPGGTAPSLPLFSMLIVFGWMILAALPAIISDEGIPHALRSILMLPPAIIFAALGGIWCYKSIQKYAGRKFAITIAAIFLVAVAAFAYVDYFIIWAGNPNVPGTFNADYVTIGREINALPASTPKYVVVEAGGVMVVETDDITTSSLPMPAETTIFITDTFLPAQQQAKNVHYLLPDQTNRIPAGTPASDIFYIR
jgi:4-amino-4-deoxy-L-arabinose transferase-like glycosyltransferase